MTTTLRPALECLRCGHTWRFKGRNPWGPDECPRCNSKDWDKPRKTK